MGISNLRLNQQIKAVSFVGLFSIVALMQKVSATEFKVGGAEGWKVPSDPNALHYNQWAEKNRFVIGDTLLFVYPPNQDSVLHVTKEDYTNCNTATFIESFSNGLTAYKMNQSGPYYFISGRKDNCLKNEKMAVVVLGDRTKSAAPVSSPPPPSSDTTDDMIPSPAPSGELAPSTPAQSPPKNGASSTLISLVGSFGAFFSSCLLLVS